MQLHFNEYGGEGKPTLVLLHGLLGSSRNWVTVGKLLCERFHVFAIDLRNHGQSPHSDQMSYPSMVSDVTDWLDTHCIETTHLIGHSMGGKVAMLLAMLHPHKVNALTVADIAPKKYPPHFKAAFDAMHQMNPNEFKRISEVDVALTPHLKDAVMRQFLITNLKRNEAGNFDWQINLPAITGALDQLSESSIEEGMTFTGPSQFLYGENSDFVLIKDWPIIERHFPYCKIVKVPKSGHNVHVENRHFFTQQMFRFLDHLS